MKCLRSRWTSDLLGESSDLSPTRDSGSSMGGQLPHLLLPLPVVGFAPPPGERLSVPGRPPSRVLYLSPSCVRQLPLRALPVSPISDGMFPQVVSVSVGPRRRTKSRPVDHPRLCELGRPRLRLLGRCSPCSDLALPVHRSPEQAWVLTPCQTV